MTGRTGSLVEAVADGIDRGSESDETDHLGAVAAPPGGNEVPADAPLTDSDADLALFEEIGRDDPGPADERGYGRLGPLLLIFASVVIVIASLLVLSP